jgi:hypothetical protein
MKSIAELLEQAAQLPVNSPPRRELEQRILEETGITNMNQLATLVEALGISAALENGAYGDQDTAEELFAHAKTIADTLRRSHEVIQTIA